MTELTCHSWEKLFFSLSSPKAVSLLREGRIYYTLLQAQLLFYIIVINVSSFLQTFLIVHFKIAVNFLSILFLTSLYHYF